MAIDFNQDYFQLFEINCSVEIDEDKLEKKYLDFQKKFHPDKFVNSTDYEKRLSLQITSYINEAYETLKDEYLKSLYLLKIKGYEINDQNSTISDPDFLMHQMELREELENLKKTKNKIEKDKFTEKIIDLKKNCLLDFTKYFKNEAFGDASKKIKKMKFYISIENDIKKDG